MKIKNIKNLFSIKRFKFGENWRQFIDQIDQNNIDDSNESLLSMLNLKNLSNKTFIDIGSGSGLSSLAARNLGAKVFSFDYDIKSVESTKLLRERFQYNDDYWKIDHGSVLDKDYLKKLGQFDIVYSWGVLHHTGNMWESFENIMSLTHKDSLLFKAIYNDQGWKSKVWWLI